MRRFFISICLLVLCALVLAPIIPTAHAQTVTDTEVYSFCSLTNCADGIAPVAGLVQGPDGNFYGSTVGAEGDAQYPQNSGTLFKLTPTGTLTTLEAFCSGSAPSIYCQDGSEPNTMILGKDGNFYGTTAQGGANVDRCTQGYCGTIFQLTPAGIETILYSFCSVVVNTSSVCQDGEFPIGTLVQGTDGNFYGTTVYGGNSSQGSVGGGTIFQLTPSGKLTTLYNFCKGQTTPDSCADGNFPSGGLVQGSDGNFYGTTPWGGANGAGTVFQFKMTGASAGTLTTIYNFTSGGDYGPQSTLVEGSDGSFYGTTVAEGTHDGGMAFKVTTAGSLTVLYNFCADYVTSDSRCIDGAQAQGGLTLAGDGNFYGTTEGGGNTANYNEGTAYELTPAGGFTSLYSFCTVVNSGFCTDGEYPIAGLTPGSDGNLYGTTKFGGAQQDGNVYKLAFSTPLPAPVQLALSDSSVAPNTAVKLTWKTVNAFSRTMQQCNAFVRGGAAGAGTWTGPQTGSVTGGVYTGSADITPTAVGTYTYALTCGGTETGFATLTVTNSGSKSNTTTTLKITPNPATVGQTVTLTATVAKDSGSGTPAGTVAIYIGGTDKLTTLTLVNGSATLAVATGSYPAGTYSVTAEYSGDSGDNASTSAPVSEVLTPTTAQTTTAITLSPAMPRIGQNVQISVAVTQKGASGIPTGKVTLYATYKGSTFNLDTLTLNSEGAAELTASTSHYPPGRYTVYASYAGDTRNSPSQSASKVVNLEYATVTTVTVAPNPVTPPASATGTVTVTRPNYAGTPGGSVNLYLEGNLLTSVPLDASGVVSGSYSTAGIPAGTYNVTADYLGDDSDAASSGQTTVTIK